MKKITLLISVLLLTSCSSEESDSISSSDLIYNLESIGLIINYPTGTGNTNKLDISIERLPAEEGFLKLKGAGELSLSVNDQLSLTAPNGNMALGESYQGNGLLGSYTTCCEFNFGNTSNQAEPANMSFEELQANNTWRMEFKRQGTIEDGFNIHFPALLEIENMNELVASANKDFTIKVISKHNSGHLAVMMFSKCLNDDDGVGVELEEGESIITIPLTHKEGCSDSDASMLIVYEAEAKTNTTTDLLNVPINNKARLVQNFNLPLTVN
jgi:hypothetical protein